MRDEDMNRKRKEEERKEAIKEKWIERKKENE